MTINLMLGGLAAVALIDSGCSAMVVSRRLVAKLGVRTFQGKSLSFC